MRNISSRLVSSLSEESMTWQQVSIHEDISRLISSLRSSAESIAIGLDAPPNPDRDVFVSLARLYAFHVKVNSMLWTRRANHRDKSDIDFSLGQVVRHKIYGFRGLVAAWDTKPRMDVSNWDGLSHIERPEEKPFYHIYPDANDCIKAFGGTRSFRYVCQDNLELCPVDDPLDFEMTLDPDEWKWDCDVGRYTPSMEMKVSLRLIFGSFAHTLAIYLTKKVPSISQFLYAEDIGEHAVMLEETFRDLRVSLVDLTRMLIVSGPLIVPSLTTKESIK
jgi:hemimethylated DNA binding protein